MKIREINRGEGRVEIAVSGDLDISSCEAFKQEVNTMIQKDDSLIMDGRELDYIDSVGLGALISIQKKIKGEKGGIVLRHLRPNVKKIFEITDLDKIFTLED